MRRHGKVIDKMHGSRSIFGDEMDDEMAELISERVREKADRDRLPPLLPEQVENLVLQRYRETGSASGLLVDRLPDVSWAEFEEASQQAIADADTEE